MNKFKYSILIAACCAALSGGIGMVACGGNSTPTPTKPGEATKPATPGADEVKEPAVEIVKDCGAFVTQATCKANTAKKCDWFPDRNGVADKGLCAEPGTGPEECKLALNEKQCNAVGYVKGGKNCAYLLKKKGSPESACFELKNSCADIGVNQEICEAVSIVLGKSGCRFRNGACVEYPKEKCSDWSGRATLGQCTSALVDDTVDPTNAPFGCYAVDIAAAAICKPVVEKCEDLDKADFALAATGAVAKPGKGCYESKAAPKGVAEKVETCAELPAEDIASAGIAVVNQGRGCFVAAGDKRAFEKAGSCNTLRAKDIANPDALGGGFIPADCYVSNLVKLDPVTNVQMASPKGAKCDDLPKEDADIADKAIKWAGAPGACYAPEGGVPNAKEKATNCADAAVKKYAQADCENKDKVGAAATQCFFDATTGNCMDQYPGDCKGVEAEIVLQAAAVLAVTPGAAEKLATAKASCTNPKANANGQKCFISTGGAGTCLAQVLSCAALHPNDKDKAAEAITGPDKDKGCFHPTGAGPGVGTLLVKAATCAEHQAKGYAIADCVKANIAAQAEDCIDATVSGVANTCVKKPTNCTNARELNINTALDCTNNEAKENCIIATTGTHATKCVPEPKTCAEAKASELSGVDCTGVVPGPCADIGGICVDKLNTCDDLGKKLLTGANCTDPLAKTSLEVCFESKDPAHTCKAKVANCSDLKFKEDCEAAKNSTQKAKYLTNASSRTCTWAEEITLDDGRKIAPACYQQADKMATSLFGVGPCPSLSELLCKVPEIIEDGRSCKYKATGVSFTPNCTAK